MKQLKKANLDELAKKLPVNTAEENQQCVGGNYYFNNSGYFIGETGPGQDIRITTSSDFNTYRNDPNALVSVSRLTSQASIGMTGLAVLASHFTHPTFGIESSNIIIYSGVYVNGDLHLELPAAYNGNKIFLNNDQKYISTFDNYLNMASAFRYATSSGFFSGAELVGIRR